MFTASLIYDLGCAMLISLIAAHWDLYWQDFQNAMQDFTAANGTIGEGEGEGIFFKNDQLPG